MVSVRAFSAASHEYAPYGAMTCSDDFMGMGGKKKVFKINGPQGKKAKFGTDSYGHFKLQR